MVSSQETQSKVMYCVTGPGARTLRKTYVKTAYLDKDGKVKEEFAQVWGTTRSASRESVLVLKVVLKVKDDQSSDDENPPYVYVRKSDLLSIEPVKWENHMALDPCLVGMNINDSYMKICHHLPCFPKMVTPNPFRNEDFSPSGFAGGLCVKVWANTSGGHCILWGFGEDSSRITRYWIPRTPEQKPV